MRLCISPQPDGRILVWGYYKSPEYNYSARHFIAPGNAFGGLSWDELMGLAWIETSDAGEITHKEPRGKQALPDANAERPTFLRDRHD